ncbi:hypothetical protein ABEF93_002315 [Exophiala dermatitidis]
MAHAARGAAALAASDAPTALAEYTQALIEHPKSPDYLTQRSIAFTRLKPPRYDLALRDAEYAVLLGFQRAVREKIQAAQQRRVVALYGLGRYADAKYLLTTMERWRPKDNKPAKMEGDMWMARVESKLNSVPEADRVPTVKERPEIELLSEDQLRAQYKAELNPDGSYKLDNQTSEGQSSTTTTTGTTSGTATTSNNDKAATTSTTAASTEPNSPPYKEYRYDWYQNAQSVIVSIYVKGVSRDSCIFNIYDDSFCIEFLDRGRIFLLDPIFALIDPSQSKVSVFPTKIELTLHKAQPGQKWPSLEGTEPLYTSADTKTNFYKDVLANAAPASESSQSKATTTPATTTTTTSNAPPTYPTSSRHGPKDWDKLANDLHAKSKKKKTDKKKDETSAENNDPGFKNSDDSEPVADDDDIDSDFETGDPVDAFFKKLYSNADPDTQRAMMKSFIESKGTALSTNWSEVGKGPVEEVKSKNDN